MLGRVREFINKALNGCLSCDEVDLPNFSKCACEGNCDYGTPCYYERYIRDFREKHKKWMESYLLDGSKWREMPTFNPCWFACCSEDPPDFSRERYDKMRMEDFSAYREMIKSVNSRLLAINCGCE